jgi:hypothetical protein
LLFVEGSLIYREILLLTEESDHWRPFAFAWRTKSNTQTTSLCCEAITSVPVLTGACGGLFDVKRRTLYSPLLWLYSSDVLTIITFSARKLAYAESTVIVYATFLLPVYSAKIIIGIPPLDASFTLKF